MLTRHMPALAATIGFFSISAIPQLAHAQSDQPAASSAGIEEIVVTARRKEEKAQSVPITITSFTQDTLQNQSIRTANDQRERNTQHRHAFAAGSIVDAGYVNSG